MADMQGRLVVLRMLKHVALSYRIHKWMDMAHIICGGFRSVLLYSRGANNVRCSCCQTLNHVRDRRHSCILMEHHLMGNASASLPVNRPNRTVTPATIMPSSSPVSYQIQTTLNRNISKVVYSIRSSILLRP